MRARHRQSPPLAATPPGTAADRSAGLALTPEPETPGICNAAKRRGGRSSRLEGAEGMLQEASFEDGVGVEASEAQGLAGDVDEGLGRGHADQLARQDLHAVVRG